MKYRSYPSHDAFIIKKLIKKLHILLKCSIIETYEKNNSTVLLMWSNNVGKCNLCRKAGCYFTNTRNISIFENHEFEIIIPKMLFFVINKKN